MSNKAHEFAALHIKGAPVVLYNCWDAGSAAAIAAGGAPALATGSLAVAAVQGYGDGEQLPMTHLLRLATHIAGAQDVPLSVDFEGAYGDAPEIVAAHAKMLADTGAIGMNFEDRRVQGAGLWDIEEHCARIAAIRAAVGPDFFINARTDLFLQSDAADHAGLVAEASARGQAYAAAGASGFFVPKLGDAALIAQICAQVSLPVNVLVFAGLAPRADLEAAGVARISYGPASYSAAMQAVTLAAQAIYLQR
jgi:2-methylisocitrate lyase-like PEP mutase family enzyme